jgi:hypothetical protein
MSTPNNRYILQCNDELLHYGMMGIGDVKPDYLAILPGWGRPAANGPISHESVAEPSLETEATNTTVEFLVLTTIQRALRGNLL